MTHIPSETAQPAAPPKRRLAPSSLLKSSSLIVGARICGAAIGILTQILLAKLLSAEDVGLFFVVTGLAAVLSIVCTLGYPMLVPRIAAEAAGSQGALLLRSFMRHARKDAAILCVALASMLALAWWMMPWLSPGLRSGLIFAALTLPAFALLRLNGSLANAQKRFSLGFLPDLFVRPVLLLAFVLALWAGWDQLSLEAVFAGHIVIALSLALWQFYKVRGATEATGPRSDIPPKTDGTLTAAWRRRAAPLVIVALFIGVFADLDIVIARLFLDDAQTGIFGVCLKISLFVAFGIQAIHQLILRDTADALHAGDNGRAHRVIARANVLTLAGSVGATLFVVAFGRELLAFFGAEFTAGFECLVILMLAQVLRAAAGPAAHVLTLAGHERTCLPVFVISLVLLLAGNLVLIKAFGLLGAAATVLVVSMLWSVWLAVKAHTILGLKTNILIA